VVGGRLPATGIYWEDGCYVKRGKGEKRLESRRKTRAPKLFGFPGLRKGRGRKRELRTKEKEKRNTSSKEAKRHLSAST